ncbi:hypothetical protein RDV78_05715 [Bacillota bacterium LX-D]|nr:hypothetical protein [Bacillota bacterium LX-D]
MIKHIDEYLERDEFTGRYVQKRLEDGILFVENKEIYKAKEAFKDILRLCPGAYPIQNNLAFCYYLEKKYEEAKKLFKQITEEVDEDLFSHAILAVCYLKTGQQGLAKKALKKAIQLYEVLILDELLEDEEFEILLEALVEFKEHEKVYSIGMDQCLDRKSIYVKLLVGIAAINSGHLIDAIQILNQLCIEVNDWYLPELYLKFAKLTAEGIIPDTELEYHIDLPDNFSGDLTLVSKPTTIFKLLLVDTLYYKPIKKLPVLLENALQINDAWLNKLWITLLKDRQFPDGVKQKILINLIDKKVIAVPRDLKLLLMVNIQMSTLRLMPKFSEEDRAILNKGIEASDAGRLLEAEKCYYKIIEKYPTYIPIYLNLSNAYRLKKQYDAAEELLTFVSNIMLTPSIILNLIEFYLYDKVDYYKAKYYLDIVSNSNLSDEEKKVLQSLEYYLNLLKDCFSGTIKKNLKLKAFLASLNKSYLIKLAKNFGIKYYYKLKKEELTAKLALYYKQDYEKMLKFWPSEKKDILDKLKINGGVYFYQNATNEEKEVFNKMLASGIIVGGTTMEGQQIVALPEAFK